MNQQRGSAAAAPEPHSKCASASRPVREAERPTRLGTQQCARQKLTVAELCTELRIARSTFYDWRAKKTAPPCIKLPNGELRVRRSDLDAWLDSRQEPES